MGRKAFGVRNCDAEGGARGEKGKGPAAGEGALSLLGGKKGKEKKLSRSGQREGREVSLDRPDWQKIREGNGEVEGGHAEGGKERLANGAV